MIAFLVLFTSSSIPISYSQRVFSSIFCNFLRCKPVFLLSYIGIFKLFLSPLKGEVGQKKRDDFHNWLWSKKI